MLFALFTSFNPSTRHNGWKLIAHLGSGIWYSTSPAKPCLDKKNTKALPKNLLHLFTLMLSN